MSWRTKAALESVGLTAPSHRSRQATDAELRHAALVIALAPEHVHWVRRTHPRPRRAPRRFGDSPATCPPTTRRCPSGSRPSTSPHVELGDWEEVVDPGGGDADEFAACAAEVVELVAALAPRLVGGEGDVTEHLTADEAAGRLDPIDTIGMPLGRASRRPSSRPSAAAPTGRTCGSWARCSACSPTSSPIRTSTT